MYPNDQNAAIEENLDVARDSVAYHERCAVNWALLARFLGRIRCREWQRIAIMQEAGHLGRLAGALKVLRDEEEAKAVEKL